MLLWVPLSIKRDSEHIGYICPLQAFYDKNSVWVKIKHWTNRASCVTLLCIHKRHYPFVNPKKHSRKDYEC